MIPSWLANATDAVSFGESCRSLLGWLRISNGSTVKDGSKRGGVGSLASHAAWDHC